jgi:DNA-binding transcriptional MocR family regulator
MRITGHHKRTGVPFVRTSCMILGDKQIDTFEAMLALTGRRPNQLVADLILAAIQKGQTDPEVQHMAALLRDGRRGLYNGTGLYIVKDSAS